jgi:hypothetical protein
MDAEVAFTPLFSPGGFSAHCTNQAHQIWKITRNPTNPPIKVHLRKDGKYHSSYGEHQLSDVPVKFYDYNF